MPIYDDYKCTDEKCDGMMKDVARGHCGTGGEPPSCPKCGAAMQIDWTTKAASFSLRGPGWFGKGRP